MKNLSIQIVSTSTGVAHAGYVASLYSGSRITSTMPYKASTEAPTPFTKDVREWVAMDDDKIIGIMQSRAICGYGEPSFIELLDLYVEPRYRLHGIGSCLLGNLNDWAAEKRCEFIDVIVNKDNGVGQVFLSKHKYKKETPILPTHNLFSKHTKVD